MTRRGDIAGKVVGIALWSFLIIGGVLIWNALQSSPPPSMSEPVRTPLEPQSGEIDAFFDPLLTPNCRLGNPFTFLLEGVLFGGYEFDFVVPAAREWSIGMLYHEDGVIRLNIGPTKNGAATFVASHRSRIANPRVWADHWTRVDHLDVDSIERVDIGDVFNSEIGARNNIAIGTTDQGTELKVNGTTVLVVPLSDLRPQPSHPRVCVGLESLSSSRYMIEYSRLTSWYAWAR